MQMEGLLQLLAKLCDERDIQAQYTKPQNDGGLITQRCNIFRQQLQEVLKEVLSLELPLC